MDDVTQRLGSYLLKGWCMMGDSCPLCRKGIPLMKDKAGDLYCVDCEMYTNKENHIPAPSSPNTTQPTNTQPTPHSTNKESDEPAHLESRSFLHELAAQDITSLRSEVPCVNREVAVDISSEVEYMVSVIKKERMKYIHRLEAGNVPLQEFQDILKMLHQSQDTLQALMK